MIINGKKYKIVNRLRFITFITVALLVISFSIVGVFGLTNANGSENQKYIEVEICSGDTLWELAESYGNSNTDIRQTVYEICELNNIKANDLHAGQVILIPDN